ncbi:MAG TPA: rifamycin-inactivating phosphotransferase [Gemmatimonadaceae bacterium]
MIRYVVDLREVGERDSALVGGKGANLGELSRIAGIRVPSGFCVTTNTYRLMLREAPSVVASIAQLTRLEPADHEAIRSASAEIRRSIEGIAIPDDVAAAIANSIGRLGEDMAQAVRSSATAEDLPTASFAGQHDTYLEISGTAAILHHVRRCWASLFTERAVTYRLRNGVDHRRVHMAVVVQQMVSPRASGVLFTADPVTGNRKVVSVEASLGLGEALVSGLVNADVYAVRDGDVAEKKVRGAEPVLTDAQIRQLADLGRQIEAHFGRPQDVEWCLADADFRIVQSRPITTLFPVPVVSDGERHVYLSTGHQQMMTDAMKPLGLSMWRLTGATTFHEAGGRLFVDVSRALASPAGRAGLLAMAGKSDPLTGDALKTIIDRGFIPTLPDPNPAPVSGAAPPPMETDPAIVAELIATSEASNARLKADIQQKSGLALFDFILADVQELKRVIFNPRSHQAIMASVEATWWLNERLEEWIGEKNAAHVLAQSVPNNVTSEMGLDLLRVADVIRPHPAVVAFLERTRNEHFLSDLPRVAGGVESRDAIQSWLDKYGMRGAGEIDITRPRWIERPTALIPLILGNVRNFEPGAAELRFEQGLVAASRKEEELLARVLVLPDGERKAHEVKRMIDRLRTFAGYREYPKYFMVNRHFAYKQALLREADRLVQENVLRDRGDIYYLTFQELQAVVVRNAVDERLIEQRKEAFRIHERLTPPRVLTSEGEMLNGAYRRDDFPPGALVGLAVSAGIAEGRARVVVDPARAYLEPGDILVTRFTDPSWTPYFVAIAGLVTEVGGLMTHGAVIAREYGLAAVVGVEGATRLIRDGQLIRVDGTNGFVEILS